jgi:hypothetical protein
MPKGKREKPIIPSDLEAEIREELERIAADMTSLRFRLWGAHTLMPVSPREEIMLLGEEEPDFATEARSIIECVIHDAIDSAIEDLITAARYGLEEEEPE